MEIPKINPDVVHLHTVLSGLPIALLKLSKKIVYTSHNPAWVAEKLGFSNALINCLESIIFRRVDQITAVSNYQKKCILKKSNIRPEKISVIHNFIEMEEKEVEYEGKPIVLFLGKHTKHKGIHIFVEAAELIQEKIPVRVISIGPTGRFGEVGEKFWRDSSVEFLGAVSEDKKVELLHKASVILCPTDREGHSLVHLEAQAAGLPVVVTDIPPSKEAINAGKTGLLAKRTPEDFAEKAVKILEEDWKRTHADEFPKWMEKFSKEKIGGKWLEFYRELSSK
jgi:glycosyltransferase involved in cell wall biosynthesis